MYDYIKKLLDAKTITKEVADALQADAEKMVTQLRDENAQFRTKNKELTDSFNDVSKSKELLEAKASDFDKKIEDAREGGKKEVVKQLEAEKQKNQQTIDSLAQFEKENRALKVQNAVQIEMGKYKVKTDVKEDVASIISSQAQVGENGITFGDGKTLEDGVKSFFENRQSYIEPQGQGQGSGANSGNSSTKTMKRSQFDTLDAVGKVSTIKDGFTIED